MRLVIFDCDGTLVDSQLMIVEAMKAAFAARGLMPPERAKILRHVGLSVTEAMTAMTGLIDPKAIEALAKNYRTAFSRLRQEARLASPLFPGAREALMQLSAEDDVLLGIATGKSRRGVDHLLRKEGFHGIFATIQTADNAPSKPHPAMIHQALEATGTEPSEAVMIGDTHFDMLMARAASVKAIGVGWGYQEPADLIKAGAASVAENFKDLVAFLMRGKRMGVS